MLKNKFFQIACALAVAAILLAACAAPADPVVSKPCIPMEWDGVLKAFSLLRSTVTVDAVISYGNSTAGVEALATQFGWNKEGNAASFLESKGIQVTKDWPTEGQSKLKASKNNLCAPPPSLTPQGPQSDPQTVPVVDGQSNLAPIAIPKTEAMPLWVWGLVAAAVALSLGCFAYARARAGGK